MSESLAKAHEEHAATLFRQLPNISIDYALLEKSEEVFCIRASFPWDDVGSFDSLLRTMPLDENGNVVIGQVLAKDCSGCVLYNDSDEQILTAVGLRDMILVQTNDAVMTASISDAQRVKEIVQLLGSSTYL
jgi:mannose-1-phosphate guanylyltransferase